MRIQSLNININYNTPKIAVQQKPTGVCCPHGNPGGSCPLCLGMGGGGGSSVKAKPTAKELGLLTWADLLPAWNALLAANQSREYDKKLDTLLAMKKFIDQSNIYKAISNFVDSKIMPVLKFLNSQVLIPIVKTINQTIQSINNLYTELKTQLMHQMTKLAGVLNEKFQQITDKLKQVTELIKNAMEMLLSNLKEKEKALKEFLTAFANRVKKKLFRIIEALDNSFEDVREQKNNEKDYEELLNV